MTFEWSPAGAGLTQLQAGQATATFKAADEGSFSFTATACDPAQCSPASDPVVVDVNNVDPWFVTPPVDAVAETGQPVSVAATVTDPGTLDVLTATVDWGDGGGATPVAVAGGAIAGTHTYVSSADFAVQLCVRDNDMPAGQTVCRPFTVTITPDVAVPEVAVTVTPRTLAGSPLGDSTGLGDDFVYHVEVRNTGGTSATGVELNVPLSGDHRVVSIPSGCIQSATGAVSCTLGTIAAGAPPRTVDRRPSRPPLTARDGEIPRDNTMLRGTAGDQTSSAAVAATTRSPEAAATTSSSATATGSTASATATG